MGTRLDGWLDGPWEETTLVLRPQCHERVRRKSPLGQGNRRRKAPEAGMSSMYLRS